MITCPICANAEGATCAEVPAPNFRGAAINCTSCGLYKITSSLLASFAAEGKILNRLQRASLSHVVRQQSDHANTVKLHDSDFDYFKKIPALPSPPQQAKNAIRVIGNHERETGEHLNDLPNGFFAQIGALSRARAVELCKELLVAKLIRVKNERETFETNRFERCALTFSGWEQYEAERLGKLAGDYGFIAMKFGDAVLDSFLSDAIRPAVESLSFKLVDMRDVAQAGIIDNIMRVTIRDSAFVLVDLTHDNAGAYWEAGYAEGIGKPVIYLCEKAKFDTKSTHFDTNHLTTVPWEAANGSDFSDRLVATLRNTLRIF
jgi:nucleoside 2-deoxyribosyltransferase